MTDARSTKHLARHLTTGGGLVIGFAVLLATAAAGRAAELKFPLLWQTDLQSFLESSGLVADLRGDGCEEAVIAGREDLFALDGHGKVLWRWRCKGRFMTYPAVLTRPGHLSLVYAADYGGRLNCVNGAGKEVWQAKLNGPSSWSACVVCDLKGDGDFEVIQTDETGAVWAMSALTGKVLWQTKIKGIPVSPAVGDLDGDGKPEIAVATGQGIVTALSGDGRVLWERSIGGSSPSWATAASVLFAGSDGRGRVAAASSSGELLCLDSKGDVLWRRPTRGAAASTISVGDLDLDGRADICLVTQTGVIHRFDEDGRAIWEIDMQGRSLAPGAIIDLNGDGKLEYVLCTQDGFLQVLNDQGEFLHRFHFSNRTINVTPTFGKLSADSPVLEMLITGGESGIAFCLGTPAATNAVSQWKSYRCDTRNSGSWFGLRRTEAVRMAPVNLAAAACARADRLPDQRDRGDSASIGGCAHVLGRCCVGCAAGAGRDRHAGHSVPGQPGIMAGYGFGGGETWRASDQAAFAGAQRRRRARCAEASSYCAATGNGG